MKNLKMSTILELSIFGHSIFNDDNLIHSNMEVKLILDFLNRETLSRVQTGRNQNHFKVSTNTMPNNPIYVQGINM